MAAHRLILEDVFEQPFKLIAVHSSIEEYRLAYLLNKYLGLRLTRSKKDVDYNFNNLNAKFALYSFEDLQKYCSYHLVSNMAQGTIISASDTPNLFQQEDIFRKFFLLPEFKKVDYFLKIVEESEVLSIDWLLKRIQEIPQVSTAYLLNSEKIKSKDNLIFD